MRRLKKQLENQVQKRLGIDTSYLQTPYTSSTPYPTTFDPTTYLAQFLPQTSIPAQHTPSPYPTQAPAPPPGTYPPPPPNARPPPKQKITRNQLLPHDHISQIYARPHSARAVLGDHAVIEARKGLSRLLRADDPNDLSLFAHQLHTSDKAACEPNYQNYTETVPSFALSYVQQRPPEGSRFKFSSEQWQRFLRIVGELCKCGVVHFRVWLDQCLWLRDASQESWAHTGIMPYILWPVLSLGDRVMGADRTWQSRQRMWPFVEEVAGLWSLGLIMASEMRGKTMQSGVRDWMSFNLRLKCEPERSVWIVLLNIFHGATDHLQTGWREDVEELNEMAKLNFTRQVQNVIIGSDWRSRVTSAQFRYDVVTAVMLPVDPKYFGMPGQGVDMYLDGSRTVFNQDRWDGKQEWLSGMNIKLPYDFPNVNGLDVMGFMSGLSGLAWWNVITDKGEFQLLSNNALTSALWLLVAMDGATSGYGRGHVAWTKVLHGKITCELSRFSQITATQFDDGGYMLVQKAIQEQLERQVQILSLKLVTGVNIEWT